MCVPCRCAMAPVRVCVSSSVCAYWRTLPWVASVVPAWLRACGCLPVVGLCARKLATSGERFLNSRGSVTCLASLRRLMEKLHEIEENSFALMEMTHEVRQGGPPAVPAGPRVVTAARCTCYC